MKQATGSSVEEISPSASTEDVMSFHVKNHPHRMIPLKANQPFGEEADQIDIRVVGVGPLGNEMVQILPRYLSGVWCHEVLKDNEGDSTSDLTSLLSSVSNSDLVFIITGNDDDSCTAVAQAVGAASVGAGVLTLVVAPQTIRIQSSENLKWYDTVFTVTDCSFPDQEGAATLTSYSLTGIAMRHVVSTITDLITHRTGVCIDFADIKSIMRSGTVGRMGVGIGSGDARGTTAAIQANNRLAAQGVDVSSATGILAAVHGSGSIRMKDFDTASKVNHDHASADANLLVGLISDERLGGNVKATVLTVHPS